MREGELISHLPPPAGDRDTGTRDRRRLTQPRFRCRSTRVKLVKAPIPSRLPTAFRGTSPDRRVDVEMAKTGYTGPSNALRLYELAVKAAGWERKGATMPYTSAGGHMTSFLDPTGAMALRLPPALREEFLSAYGSRIVEQHGRVMPDFVLVPEGLLSETAELQRWLERATM